MSRIESFLFARFNEKEKRNALFSKTFCSIIAAVVKCNEVETKKMATKSAKRFRYHVGDKKKKKKEKEKKETNRRNKLHDFELKS